MALELTDLQQVVLTINAKNAAGNNVVLADTAWHVADTSILVATPDDSGLLARVVTTGVVGSTQVQFTCTSGGVTLSASLDVNVVAAPATEVSIVVGEITDRVIAV